MAAQLGVGTAPEGWVPVERRWLGLDRRSIVPAVVVVALVVLMSIVLPAINAATPYNDKVVSGDVMQVQYGVQFTPTPGWGITSGVRVGDAPAGGGYPASASVTTGSVVLTVKVDKYTGTAGKLLNKIRSTSDRLKTDSGLHVNGPSHTARPAAGSPERSRATPAPSPRASSRHSSAQAWASKSPPWAGRPTSPTR